MTTMMPAAPAADVKHLFADKVRRGIFWPVARHLREDLAEDRLAEGVGLAFEQYVADKKRKRRAGARNQRIASLRRSFSHLFR